MSNNIHFLGIDIGGAHIKIVGLNKDKKINFIDYRKCYLWKGLKQLDNEIKFINSLSTKKNTLCGLTTTAELCDIFPDRKKGGEIIFEKCKKIKFDKYFYSLKKEKFHRINTLIPKKTISMNWHSIGEYVRQKKKDALVIDFGSTTTDFLCIKNGEIINQNFSDFSRLNSGELLYSGLMRTPIFALDKFIEINSKKFFIIPEFFSNMSDVYRINKKLKKSFDIENEVDFSEKKIGNSFVRLSRSFGIDFTNKNKNLLYKLSKKLIKIQLSLIENNINKLKKKYKLNKNIPIILSGIGQDVLNEFLQQKNVIFLKELVQGTSDKISKEATYHAPALCIANLLDDFIK